MGMSSNNDDPRDDVPTCQEDPALMVRLDSALARSSEALRTLRTLHERIARLRAGIAEHAYAMGDSSQDRS